LTQRNPNSNGKRLFSQVAQKGDNDKGNAHASDVRKATAKTERNEKKR
jgi:hypothetical protein